MVELKRIRLPLAMLIVALLSGSVFAQSHAQARRAKASAICGNPQVRCVTSVQFEPYDLPFRVPRNSVIFDTDLFYVVILKSVAAGDNDCETFISETERLATQALFPDHKVFTSRCAEAPYLFYTNINDKQRIMAVYAGTTLAESKRVLSAVQATGKFPGANLRRMRTGFNGT